MEPIVNREDETVNPVKTEASSSDTEFSALDISTETVIFSSFCSYSETSQSDFDLSQEEINMTEHDLLSQAFVTLERRKELWQEICNEASQTK